MNFEDIRTVNGEVCSSFREAAFRMNLILDDSEWDLCLMETSNYALPSQIRHLFAVLLLYCFPMKPEQLFLKHLPSMAEDFLHDFLNSNQTQSLSAVNDHVRNLVLLDIERILNFQNKSLSDFPGGWMSFCNLLNIIYYCQFQLNFLRYAACIRR